MPRSLCSGASFLKAPRSCCCGFQRISRYPTTATAATRPTSGTKGASPTSPGMAMSKISTAKHSSACRPTHHMRYDVAMTRAFFTCAIAGRSTGTCIQCRKKRRRSLSFWASHPPLMTQPVPVFCKESNVGWLMSALGQKRTSHQARVMSALPPKADIGTQSWNVRFVPKADSCTAAKKPLGELRLLCFRPHEPATL